jgi:hypothetical protein
MLYRRRVFLDLPADTKELSCARRCACTAHILSLTFLSNVVAYACRHSRIEDRRHAHRSAFFGYPSTGDQSFALQGFAAARNLQYIAYEFCDGIPRRPEAGRTGLSRRGGRACHGVRLAYSFPTDVLATLHSSILDFDGERFVFVESDEAGQV